MIVLKILIYIICYLIMGIFMGALAYGEDFKNEENIWLIIVWPLVVIIILLIVPVKIVVKIGIAIHNFLMKKRKKTADEVSHV